MGFSFKDDANTSVTSFSKALTLSTENLQEKFESTNTMFMSVEEEESWRKSRRRKDNHNISMYSRVYNIHTTHCMFNQNSGQNINRLQYMMTNCSSENYHS